MKIKVLISGGGTGGHIFPALSIANAIKEQRPDTEFLFVGAKGKMEMEKVPAAGYKIVGIPARGLKRPLYSLSNIGVAWDYLRCRILSGKIIKEFKPNLVVGVGGFASAAIIGAAGSLKIPILLQEQNSFAGLVNRKNGNSAKKICVAYEGMERFFPKDKIILTGNPIRKEIRSDINSLKREAYEFYKLNPDKKTVFIVGGSLGCRTLNNCVKRAIEGQQVADYQIIWQCGKIYKQEMYEFLRLHPCPGVICTDFINRMDLAYAAADIVVSRAGAGTISELCVVGKCTIFVPSPSVAEDHQTFNAMALVKKNAAEIIKDCVAEKDLMPRVEALIHNPLRIKELETNIQALAKPCAASQIAKVALDIIKND